MAGAGGSTGAVQGAGPSLPSDAPRLLLSPRGPSGPSRLPPFARPVLSVIGADTQPLWLEIAEFLRSSLPHVEERTIDRVGHLLQIQRPEPVAQALAEFLTRNPIAADDARRLQLDDPAQPLIAPPA